MTRKRRKHSSQFKAKVALEAVKGVKTLSELSSLYKVHPTVISQWKRRLQDEAAGIFDSSGKSSLKDEEEVTAPLYQEIGRLKVEVDWLKKKL